LVERSIEVDHVTVYRWVQRFTPLLADAVGAGNAFGLTGPRLVVKAANTRRTGDSSAPQITRTFCASSPF
jgi:hypothetical protein